MTTTMKPEDTPPAQDMSQGLDFKMDLHASPSALLRVRIDDNPHRSAEVGRFKLYIAGMMTVLEELRGRPTLVENPNVTDVPAKRFNAKQSERARCASIAITRLEDALLYAERALTT
ncbi:MAG: hypothetical protein WC829_05850 [Hyphomicrobium sp.]|jgi:hypothetical protein